MDTRCELGRRWTHRYSATLRMFICSFCDGAVPRLPARERKQLYAARTGEERFKKLSGGRFNALDSGWRNMRVDLERRPRGPEALLRYRATTYVENDPTLCASGVAAARLRGAPDARVTLLRCRSARTRHRSRRSHACCRGWSFTRAP